MDDVAVRCVTLPGPYFGCRQRPRCRTALHRPTTRGTDDRHCIVCCRRDRASCLWTSRGDSSARRTTKRVRADNPRIPSDRPLPDHRTAQAAPTPGRATVATRQVSPGAGVTMEALEPHSLRGAIDAGTPPRLSCRIRASRTPCEWIAGRPGEPQRTASPARRRHRRRGECDYHRPVGCTRRLHRLSPTGTPS